MKSFKLAVILTALFTNIVLQANHIVTVKTERILKESDAGIEIQDKVTKEQKKLTAPFEKVEMKLKEQENALMEKQKNLAKEEDKLKTEASLLSPEARVEKYDDLQRKRRDLDEEVANFQRAMRSAHEDAKKVEQKLEMLYRKEMMSFEQKVRELIKEIAKAEGWDIVLPQEILIYAGESTDKTHVIIKKMNERHAKDKEKEKKTSVSAGA